MGRRLRRRGLVRCDHRHLDVEAREQPELAETAVLEPLELLQRNEVPPPSTALRAPPSPRRGDRLHLCDSGLGFNELA